MAESHNTDEKYTVNVKELCEELADNEKVQAITIEELSPRRESLILCVYGPRNDEIKTEYDYMEIGGDEYSILFETSSWGLDTLGKVVVYSELEPVDTNEGIKRLLESAEDSSEGDIHD